MANIVIWICYKILFASSYIVYLCHKLLYQNICKPVVSAGVHSCSPVAPHNNVKDLFPVEDIGFPLLSAFDNERFNLCGLIFVSMKNIDAILYYDNT